jgi:phosphate transport system substrate-binding protein
MIQLATAWAEAYRKTAPNVMVNCQWRRLRNGIAALQNGTTDICNASREIKPEEKEK